MEEKNELSDILLNNQSTNNSSKIKKVLILSIVLVIIFILAIAGMKLFNKPKVKTNHFNIVLPPEPTIKSEPKKEELFKQVPIIEENTTANDKDNFNAMVKKLKNQESTKEEISKNIQNTKQQVETKQKKKDLKVSTKSVKKSTKHIKKSYAAKKIYIQVGVTFKTKPEKKYLKKIAKAGYSYKLYKLKISGKSATKILIGPYSSKKSAKASLAKIKRVINKAAFIYVIK